MHVRVGWLALRGGGGRERERESGEFCPIDRKKYRVLSRWKYTGREASPRIFVRSLPLLCMRHYYFDRPLFRSNHVATEPTRNGKKPRDADRVAPRIRVVRDWSATVSSGKEKKRKNNLTSSTDRLSTLGMFRSSKHGGRLFHET